MTYADEVLADSPLAYYRLGEASGTTMLDSSGNARNGIYQAPPVLGQASLLVDDPNPSADFVPTDWANVTDAAWMDAAAFTVEALIRPDVMTSYRSIINRDGANSGTRGWNFYVLNSKLHVFDNRISGGAVLTGATTLVAGTTYHVAMTSNGTNVRLYINGVQDGVATANLGNTLANNLAIGISSAGTVGVNFPWDGRLDEVAYYGTALSQARLNAHYQQSINPTTGPATHTLAISIPASSSMDIALWRDRLLAVDFTASSSMDAVLTRVRILPLEFGGGSAMDVALAIDAPAEAHSLAATFTGASSMDVGLILAPVSPVLAVDFVASSAMTVFLRPVRVIRWELLDEGGQKYIVELNPNEMSAFTFPKEFEFARRDGALARTMKARRQPTAWTFGGVVRTQSHHDSLIAWQKKPGKVRVTDHLGRTFEVLMESLELLDRRPTRSSWRFTYTFNCLLLRRIR